MDQDFLDQEDLICVLQRCVLFCLCYLFRLKLFMCLEMEVAMLEDQKLLCLCVLVRWLWDMLSWPIEQVVEREESFWFTRLTLKL